MKRSEMVKMIHNWYWNNYPKFNASDCLAIIESEGLLPPQRLEVKEVEKDIKDDDGEILKVKRKIEYMVNEWENE